MLDEVIFEICHFLGGLSLHLKPPIGITHDKLQLAMWDTLFLTFLSNLDTRDLNSFPAKDICSQQKLHFFKEGAGA